MPIDYGFSLQEAETELVIAPTLFFENLPIYAQVNETVSSEGAIAGVLNCKEKYVSGGKLYRKKFVETALC